MGIWAKQHQRRVDKPGKTTKVQFEVGEDVLVQDAKSKKWDKEGTITRPGGMGGSKIIFMV